MAEFGHDLLHLILDLVPDDRDGLPFHLEIYQTPRLDELSHLIFGLVWLFALFIHQAALGCLPLHVYIVRQQAHDFTVDLDVAHQEVTDPVSVHVLHRKEWSINQLVRPSATPLDTVPLRFCNLSRCPNRRFIRRFRFLGLGDLAQIWS